MDNLDTKKIGKYLFLGGFLVAALLALLEPDQPSEVIFQLLIAASLAAGIFYADHSDASGTVIRYMGLVATYMAFDGFIKIGEGDYLGDFITKVTKAGVWFFAPYVLTVLAMGFYKKHVSK